MKSLRLFLALGLPGGFMMGMEASSFDITTALAGRLGTVAVDAHTILLSVIGECPLPRVVFDLV
jgi:MATE family multidrug resistance protein